MKTRRLRTISGSIFFLSLFICVNSVLPQNRYSTTQTIPGVYGGFAMNSIQMASAQQKTTDSKYRMSITGLTLSSASSVIGWNLNIFRAFSFDESVYNEKNIHLVSWAEAGINLPLYRRWGNSGFFSRFVLMLSANVSLFNELYLRNDSELVAYQTSDDSRYFKEEYPRYIDFGLEFRRKWFNFKIGYLKQTKDYQAENALFSAVPQNLTGSYFEAGFTLGGWNKKVRRINPTAPGLGKIDFRLAYEDPSKNNALDSGETGAILVKLKNKGKGSASDIAVDVFPSEGDDKEISIKRTTRLYTDLYAGEINTVRIPITASKNIENGFVKFKVVVRGTNFKTMTRDIRVNLHKQITPADIIASAEFADTNDDGILSEGEKGWLVFRLENYGEWVARNVHITSELVSGRRPGFKFENEIKIPALVPNAVKNIRLPITYKSPLKPGEVRIKCTIFSENITPIKREIVFIAAHPQPVLLSIAAMLQEPSGDELLGGGESGNILLQVKNESMTRAENVSIDVNFASEYFSTIHFKEHVRAGTILPGTTKEVAIPVRAEENAEDGRVDLKLQISADNIISFSEVYTVLVKELDNVDDPIVARIEKKEAIAVVIGISKYFNSSVAEVKYAQHDAAIMREYLKSSLGFKAKNIYPKEINSLMYTKGFLSTLFKHRLPKLVRPGETEVFIYYSGHGAPSTEAQKAFLVPSDCDPEFVNASNAYALDEFYADLFNLQAKHLTVVLDACFSGYDGSGRSLLTNQSSLALKVKDPFLASSNSVLFSSCRMDEVANWYPDKKHGLFTYFFLKGLRGRADFDGDRLVTVAELTQFLTDESSGLNAKSLKLFNRSQHPQIRSLNPDRILADYKRVVTTK